MDEAAEEIDENSMAIQSGSSSEHDWAFFETSNHSMPYDDSFNGTARPGFVCGRVLPENINPPIVVGIFGIVLPLLCFIGAAGNGFNLVIFAKRRNFQATSYIYLTVLAAVHLLSLVFQSLILITINFNNLRPVFDIAFPYVLWPIYSYLSTLSLCLIVVLSGSMYIHTRSLVPRCPLIMAQRQRRAWILIAVTCIFVLATTWPRMFAYAYDFNQQCYQPRWCSLPNSWFSIYTYCRILIFNIGCLSLLITFQVLFGMLLFRKSSATLAKSKKRELKVAIGLFLYAVVCIVVELLSLLFNPITMALFWGGRLGSGAEDEFHNMIHIIQVISVLQTVEFSMTFPFSLIMNTSYRKEFLRRIGAVIPSAKSLIPVSSNPLLQDSEKR